MKTTKKNNISKFKVLTVLGTRPEIIRLSKIIEKFDTYFDHFLVNTNQNFDTNLNSIFFKKMNIRKPDITFVKSNKSLADQISKIMINTEKIILKFQPDAFFILGDTNSALSSIIAKRYKIPIFHLEAGNRAFDERVPEEINRKIVDHISDINLTYSNIAKQNLIKEGLSQDKIFKVGSPLDEVIRSYYKDIISSKVLDNLRLTKGSYFLFSFHREENLTSIKRFNFIINLIEFISKYYKKKIIVSTHPRTKDKLNHAKINFNKNIFFSKPFDFFDYVSLQMNAFVVFSDSGSISEESSLLNFPALNLRETHERQEAMEEAVVPLINSNIKNIPSLIDCVVDTNNNNSIPPDYISKNLSEKISKIIFSYIEYSNKKY